MGRILILESSTRKGEASTGLSRSKSPPLILSNEALFLIKEHLVTNMKMLIM